MRKEDLAMLHTVVFDHKIRVWWEPPADVARGARYTVFLGGTALCETTHTHAALTDLAPSTAYALRVTDAEGREVGECIVTTTPEKRRINVTEAPYFAVGDGKTLNTEALQRALDDCGEGEAVYLPAGTFMTGSLRMHGGTELYVDEGAVLQGTDDPDDYMPKIPSRFEGLHMECYAALINIGHIDSRGGPNCRGVVIRGGGSIYGGGRPLADRVIERERILMADYIASLGDKVKECENDRTIPGRKRPRLINMSNAADVVIADVSVGYGACWNVHMIYSENIVTCGCSVHSEKVWNGDGWDPDSSENCVIFDTEFKTHDNSIAIKSGKNPEGNQIGRPCVGVRIFDCHGRNCMALGSEMSGGISDVYIWDCDFTESSLGMSIKVTPKRGGYMRNVVIRNCRFANIRLRSVHFNDDGEPADTLSVVEDFLFQNLEITGESVADNGEKTPSEILLLSGLDGEENYFKRFTFDGLTIPCREDGKVQQIFIKNMKDLTFKNISFK